LILFLICSTCISFTKAQNSSNINIDYLKKGKKKARNVKDIVIKGCQTLYGKTALKVETATNCGTELGLFLSYRMF